LTEPSSSDVILSNTIIQNLCSNPPEHLTIPRSFRETFAENNEPPGHRDSYHEWERPPAPGVVLAVTSERTHYKLSI
jgi:hypothetical protein